MEKIKIKTDFIKLDQFLKWIGIVENGGEAKEVILNGLVFVNNQCEIRRGKKLYKGDTIEFQGNKYIIEQ